jgi:septation ring formation regulator EzrA
MKKSILIQLSALLFMAAAANAQQVKETKQDLPKNAAKGKFRSAELNQQTGNIEVMYHLKGDKKEDVREYKKYVFDKNITFLKDEDIHESKDEDRDCPWKALSFIYHPVN